MNYVFRSLALCFTLALTLTACPPTPDPVTSPPSPPTPPPAPAQSFTLEPAATMLTLKPGSSATVGVTVNPENGFAADVTLSSVVVESAAKLSSSYAPNPTKTSSTLTINADASSTPGTYTLLVKGSATVGTETLTSSAALEVTVQAPTTITVTGRVVNVTGLPLEGVSVSASGKPAVTTDANGAFSFTEVTKPYAATVSVGTQVHLFSGLTRADPTLALLNSSGGTALSGTKTVTGTLFGGAGYPNPANHLSEVVFAAPGAQTVFAGANSKNVAGSSAGQSGAYSLNAQWTGTNNAVGTLHALQWETDPASPTRPTTYKGYGTKSATLTNGGSVSNQNITLAPVTTGSLNLAVNAASGTTITARGVVVNLDAKSYFALVSEVTPDANATYSVPAIPGKSLSVSVSASDASGGTAIVQQNGIQPGAAVTLNIPVSPLLTAPANNLTNVSNVATLSYMPTPNAVNVVVLSSNSKTYVYYSTAASLTLRLAADTKYSWSVSAFGGYTTLDDFTGADWSTGYAVLGDNRSFALVLSPLRSFTTK
jgi:hypothetical protein